MPQEQLDTRAIELATTALARADGHIMECGRRYQDSAVALRELRDTISDRDAKHSQGMTRIYDLLEAKKESDHKWRNAVYVAVIVSLTGLVGFLLVNGPPWAG